MSDIMNVDEIWFPPANILFHGEKKLQETITSDQRKQILESMSTAVMLVGINKSTGENYYLQPVDPSEQTPDVRTMTFDQTDDLMRVQEVEVVTQDNNSSEDIDEFLKRTKLSLKKSYPTSTTILCHINKQVKQAKSWRDVHLSLKSANSPNDVYILARTDPTKQKYQLVKVNPDLTIVEFDIYEELATHPSQKVLKMNRGKHKGFTATDEQTTPFQWH